MEYGVIFRVAEALHFLPAAVAWKVLPMPGVARVPGAPEEFVGIALVDGEAVPVVAIGEHERRGSRSPRPSGRSRTDHRPMLVCEHMGERVGLVGLEIVATGRLETNDRGEVAHQGASASLFDVGAVVARLLERRWAV